MGLTEELILEILYKLPVKSLGRCKLVCKTWLTLISDPEFVKSHLDYSKKNQPLTLIYQKYNILSILKCCDDVSITESAKLNYQFLDAPVFDNGSCDRFIVGSHDGIICVYVEESKRGQDSMYIYLWNPCTTEELGVSLPVVRGSICVHIDSSWFGCVKSLEDYKIFLVYSEHMPYEKSMYLYSLRSNTWRRITHVFDDDIGLISEFDSVFLNEALHYLVRREWIVIFDLVAETFKKVPFSIEADQIPNHDMLSLGVNGEYECLYAMFVNQSEEWMFELWNLKEYGNWDSWKKMYRIDMKEDIFNNCIQFLGLTYKGILCIHHGFGLVLVDPDHDPPSYVVARIPPVEIYKVMDHVESLVSPISNSVRGNQNVRVCQGF